MSPIKKYAWCLSSFGHLLMIALAVMEVATMSDQVVPKKLPARPKVVVRTLRLQHDELPSPPEQVATILAKEEVPSSPPQETPAALHPEPVPTKKEEKPAVAAAKKPAKPAAKPATKPAKKKKPQKSSKKVSAASTCDEASLEEALAYLDQSVQTSSSPSKGKKGASTKARAIGNLASETCDIGADGGDEVASEEEWYIADLIRRLQLRVRLQEPGVVHLTLALTREGVCKKIEITKCASSATKKDLEKRLPSIKYAPFGSAFRNKKEQQFRLRLEDDGTWSSR